MNHWQTALVLWDSDARGQGSQPLVNLAEKVARLLDAPRPLTLLESTHDVWCWIATPTWPDVSVLADLAPRSKSYRRTSRSARPSPASPASAPATPRPQPPSACVSPVPHAARRRVRGCGAVAPPRPRRRHAQADGHPGDRPAAGADKNLALVRHTALVYLTTPERRIGDRPTSSLCTRTPCVTGFAAEELLGRPLTDNAAKVEIALRYGVDVRPPARPRALTEKREAAHRRST